MADDRKIRTNWEHVVEKREPPKKHKVTLCFKEEECGKKNRRIIFQKKAEQIHEEFREMHKFRDRDWMKERFLYMNEYDVLHYQDGLSFAAEFEKRFYQNITNMINIVRTKDEEKQPNILNEEDVQKYFQIMKEGVAKSMRDLEKREPYESPDNECTQCRNIMIE